MPLRFRPDSETVWIAAETRNIGVGGAYIMSTALQPIGAPLTVELRLPTTDRTFTLPAIVRWSEPAGMGVQFVNVDVDVLLELNDYFSSLTAAM